MKTPTFLEGVAVALAACIGAAVLFPVLSALFAGGLGMRLLIAVIGFVYIIYLLRRSRERIGRLVVIVAWLTAAAAIAVLHPPLLLYAVLHIAMIWLVRSLYFYSSALASLTDLGLCGLAFAFAVWAVTATGSLLFGLWSFFLVQALFVAIPKNLPRKSAQTPAPTLGDPQFQRAHQVAQAALRKLSAIH